MREFGIVLAAVAAFGFATTAPAAGKSRARTAASHTSAAPAADGAEVVSHGRFQQVTIYRPKGEIKSVVLFLSGDGGWNQGVVDMAHMLQAEGAVVAGLSIPALFKSILAASDSCSYADGDLENLSHWLQGYLHMPAYLTPVLVGYSSGATMVYGMLAQAPSGTFAGALSLGFCPELELKKPLCPGDNLKFTPSKDKKGFDLGPAPNLRNPWIAMQGDIDQVCSPTETEAFVGQVPGAEVIVLPKVGHGYSVPRNWEPQFLDAYRRILASQVKAAPPPQSLGDLPVVEVPAEGGGRQLAVMLSGDGGWAGLDRSVAEALVKRGVPVVGFDTLRYFWTPREPAGLAADLDRVVRYYAAQWKKDQVLLVGYSQGADVLPFAVNRLPAETRAMVTRTVLIAIGEKASFEFHLGNWVLSDTGNYPILPEASKLLASSTLCLYGKDEKDSLCPKVPAGHVTAEVLPGGHHFDGAYDVLAGKILDPLPSG